MLSCYDFNQSHAPLCCLPKIIVKEPGTPPLFLKAKPTYTYSCINKTTALLNEKNKDPHSKYSERLVWDGHSNSSEVQTRDENAAWLFGDTEPPQGYQNYNSTTSSFSTGSTADDESPWITCNDQRGSEDGGPGRKLLDALPSGSGILLEDSMFTDFPIAWKKRLLIRSMLQTTPKLTLHPPLSEADLNLSPTLLTSPSQGLSHSLLPEGQEALQTLFKDVWITPESTALKSPSLLCSLANESKTMMSVGNGGYLSSESEEGNKGSEEETSTPELIPLKKARPHRHTARRGHVKTQPRLKKKCVNGFIMFCRINRKLYIRSHPGISSTTVTKELAHLWRIMPKRERRIYNLKAWLFSRQQNRNVRAEVHEGEINAKDCVPSPLYMLLAHRDLYAAVKRQSYNLFSP